MNIFVPLAQTLLIIIYFSLFIFTISLIPQYSQSLQFSEYNFNNKSVHDTCGYYMLWSVKSNFNYETKRIK
jgi:hypothetical protein